MPPSLRDAPAEAGYLTLLRQPTPGALYQRLPPPWDAVQRVMVLARVRTQSAPRPWQPPVQPWPPDVAVVMERAVDPGHTLGTEALGAPPHAIGITVPAGLPWVALLTHAGPRAGDVQRERPLSAAAVPDPLHGRTPQALTAQQWQHIHAGFVAEANGALHAGAYAVGVEAGRGRLWHAAISPLWAGGEDGAEHGIQRLGMLIRCLRELTPRVAVSLVADELAVGGIHAERGMAMALRLVEAGASLLWIRTGCAHSPARMEPAPARWPHEQGPSLSVTGWVHAALGGRIPVLAAGGEWHGVAAAAVDRGLTDGVLVEDSGADEDQAGRT